MALNPPAPAVKVAPGSGGTNGGVNPAPDGTTQTLTPAGVAANASAPTTSSSTSNSLISLSPSSRNLLGGTSDPSNLSGQNTDPAAAINALNSIIPANSSALAPTTSLPGTPPSDLAMPPVQVSDQVVGAVSTAETGTSPATGGVILPPSIPEPGVLEMMVVVIVGLITRSVSGRAWRSCRGQIAGRAC